MKSSKHACPLDKWSMKFPFGETLLARDFRTQFLLNPAVGDTIEAMKAAENDLDRNRPDLLEL